MSPSPSPRARAQAREPVAIDLTSQERSVERQLPRLHRYLETYAEKLRIMVAKMVWKPAPVTVGQISVMAAQPLEEVVRKWPSGVAIVWPKVGTVGFLGLNALFCDSLIDLAYGTPADQLNVDSQAAQRSQLTRVDHRTLASTFRRLVHTLTEVLAPVDTPEATILPLGAPFQLQMPDATDSAVLCPLDFPLRNLVGNVTVVLFSPLLEHLDTTASATQKDDRGELTGHLKTTHVDLVAELGRASLLVSELSGLKAGDLLWLDRSTNEDLPVLIENKVKFFAQPRQQNGTLGVKIVGRAS